MERIITIITTIITIDRSSFDQLSLVDHDERRPYHRHCKYNRIIMRGSGYGMTRGSSASPCVADLGSCDDVSKILKLDKKVE
jgi:hypothetical protein